MSESGSSGIPMFFILAPIIFVVVVATVLFEDEPQELDPNSYGNVTVKCPTTIRRGRRYYPSFKTEVVRIKDCIWKKGKDGIWSDWKLGECVLVYQDDNEKIESQHVQIRKKLLSGEFGVPVTQWIGRTYWTKVGDSLVDEEGSIPATQGDASKIISYIDVLPGVQSR